MSNTTPAEQRAMSEGTDSTGGYAVPDLMAARTIDALCAQSVIFRAGAEMVPLESDVNKFAAITANPTPAWRAENAAVAESDPTFGVVSFAPKSLAVYTTASVELMVRVYRRPTAARTKSDPKRDADGVESDLESRRVQPGC